ITETREALSEADRTLRATDSLLEEAEKSQERLFARIRLLEKELEIQISNYMRMTQLLDGAYRLAKSAYATPEWRERHWRAEYDDLYCELARWGQAPDEEPPVPSGT